LTWEYVALAEVCEVVGGATPKTGERVYWGGVIPWVTPADLTSLSGAYISKTPRTLTEDGLRSCAAKVLPARSVLLSSRAPIGHVAINSVPMATNQGFKSLIPNRDRIDEKYLYWWLVSNKATLQRLGVGATFKEISKAIVSRVVIPLPPLPEQRRIASILDRVSQVSHLASNAQSLSGGAAAAALRLAVNRGPVEYVDLQAICTRITDGTHQSPEFTQAGVPFLFISNIIQGAVDYETTKFVSDETYRELTRRIRTDVGDILYSAVGSYGVPALVESDRPVVFQRHIAHLKPDREKIDPHYLREVLASEFVKRQADRVARGGAQKTVTLGELANFKIPVISRSAQAGIANAAQESSKLKSLLAQRVSIVAELKSSLSSRLFRA
jgi:type I restriction enzyme S subunit